MSYDRPEEILRLSRNFMECRILLSAAELNLFTLLSDAPMSAQDVSARVGGDLRAITILLDALASMGFLAKQDKAYKCPEAIAPLLNETSASSILPMLHHAAHLWRRWSNLTSVVRKEHEPGNTTGVSRSADEMRSFIGAMHVVAAPRAREIVAQVNPGSAKSLIDIGGASGTYTIAFLHAFPAMVATLFDRPEVIEMAHERLGKEGVLDRVTLVSGDFYRDEFPSGHDLAFVSAIIHQNSPEENSALFRKVFRSLNREGRIVIRDHIMEPDRVHPKEGAIFAVNMLLGTSGGGTYTYGEIEAGLLNAGFRKIRLLKKGEHMDALVEAFKP